MGLIAFQVSEKWGIFGPKKFHSALKKNKWKVRHWHGRGHQSNADREAGGSVNEGKKLAISTQMYSVYILNL